MKFIFTLVCTLTVPLSVLADNQQVKWVGAVYDLPSSHTTRHSHELVFEEQNTKKTFDIVDSPVLEELHHDTNKNYRIELEGYLTSKFLFWGGNLVVSKFNVLEESEEVPLNQPRERTPAAFEKK